MFDRFVGTGIILYKYKYLSMSLSSSSQALLSCKWETLNGGTWTSKTEGTRALDRRQLGPQ